jgi:hypothetical protein
MDAAEGKLHRGWECVHVAIADHSLIAFTQIFPNFTAASAIAFLRESVSTSESCIAIQLHQSMI